jgi:hypothetical protein
VPEPHIFISHVYEERAVAAVVQKHLRIAYREQLSIFAAFDRESIGGGRKWFNHIIENLSQSVVVLAMVSHESR